MEDIVLGTRSSCSWALEEGWLLPDPGVGLTPLIQGTTPIQCTSVTCEVQPETLALAEGKPADAPSTGEGLGAAGWPLPTQTMPPPAQGNATDGGGSAVREELAGVGSVPKSLASLGSAAIIAASTQVINCIPTSLDSQSDPP